MTDLIESPIWTEQIFQKEIDTFVEGGLDGPSNIQAKELANRTRLLKENILDRNSIYVVDSEYEYGGQNIIFTTDFYSSVSDGDYVYWHEANELFYKAIAGVTEAQSEVSGMADVTNGRVIVEGLAPTTLTPTPGDKIYLSSSTSGDSTTIDTGIVLGYYIKPGLMRLILHYNFPANQLSSIPSLRTLGTTETSACSGNDSRLTHTGDVTSDASGVTTISDDVVTEEKQILNDNTTHNISITKHGYAPKGTNVGHFLKDDGTWADIINSGGGGNPIELENAVYGDNVIGRQDLELYSEAYGDEDYHILEEFTIPLAGNYTIKWEIYAHYGAHSFAISKNYQIFSAIYTVPGYIWYSFSENLAGWDKGDLCQLVISTHTSNLSFNIKNFRLCVGNPILGAGKQIYWDNITVV